MSRNVDIVLKYYRLAEEASPEVMDLFTDDFKFHFPKFGVGRGKADFTELARCLRLKIRNVHHHIDTFSIMETSDKVCVEGMSRGFSDDGGAWEGGKTPGGRFCSIFDFEGGLISRMFIYLDPDQGAADTARFYWNRKTPAW